MPFLKAGFNGRNFDTGIRGWTRHARGNRGGFKVAELRRFQGGDYFWFGDRQRPYFLIWGEQAVIGSHWSFDLPWEAQHNLPQSALP